MDSYPINTQPYPAGRSWAIDVTTPFELLVLADSVTLSSTLYCHWSLNGPCHCCHYRPLPNKAKKREINDNNNIVVVVVVVAEKLRQAESEMSSRRRGRMQMERAAGGTRSPSSWTIPLGRLLYYLVSMEFPASCKVKSHGGKMESRRGAERERESYFCQTVANKTRGHGRVCIQMQARWRRLFSFLRETDRLVPEGKDVGGGASAEEVYWWGYFHLD